MKIYTGMTRLFRSLRLYGRGLHKADRIFALTKQSERDALFQLARRKAGGVGVEIGSAFGASSCFIAAGLRPNGGKLYCVDPWNTEYRQEASGLVCYFYSEDGKLLTYGWDEMLKKVAYKEIGRAERECPAHATFLRNTHQFRDVICSIRRDSVAAAKEFSEAIDFLFIDGWHEYEGVKRDCDAWLPKVKAGGIVVLHDSGWADGVKQVIQENVMPVAGEHHFMPNMFWAYIRQGAQVQGSRGGSSRTNAVPTR
jgi:predicted O-methyltransferase YrrM